MIKNFINMLNDTFRHVAQIYKNALTDKII